MIPYLLMLSATLVHYAEGATIKAYNRKHSGGGFMFISVVSFFSVLFFLGRYLIFDNAKADFTPEIIPYGILAGVMYAASSVFLFLAIRMGSLAVTNLILAYNVIITSFYGIIFLGEPAGVLTYVGFAIMIFALFLLKHPESNDTEDKRNSLIWFICALLGMLTSAGYSIITKAAQVRFNDTNNNEFIIIAIGFSAVANFIIGLAMERRDAFRTLRTCGPYAAVAGVANGGTNLLVILINSLIAISIASPTRSLMTKILNFILGYFIFKEKYTKKQIIGLVLVCAAVVMINLV